MSSNIDKAIELFARFGRDERLDNIREAIDIIEDILDNDGNTTNKEKAINLFKAYKKEQIRNARKVLMEQGDSDKVQKCWKVLDQFGLAELANSEEDKIELNRIKNELLVEELKCFVEKSIKSHTYSESDLGELIKRYEKIPKDE